MKLITYLSFGGNCEEALNFYKDALGGKILQISKMGEAPMDVPPNLKDKVMHARLEFDNNILFFSDTFDPSTLSKGNNVSLSLDFDYSKELDEAFNKLSVGGKVTMPPQETYWAKRFGMFVDKYGFNWMVNMMK